MKILLVVQNYTPSVGGTQSFFRHFAETCTSSYGDEVIVLTTNSYYGPNKKQFVPIAESYSIINGVHVHRFGFYRWHQPFCRLAAKIFYRLINRVPEWISSFLSGPWSPALVKAMVQANAEVIMAGTSTYLYMNYPLFRYSLQNPKPFVFQGAIHFKEDEKAKAISAKTFSAIAASEYYLANTLCEKNRLQALGIAKDTIVVTGCGVYLNDFAAGNGKAFRQQLGLANDCVLIGYLGRIEAAKNIELLLAAFQQVVHRQQPVCLVIAGYPNPGYCKQLQGLLQSFDALLKQKIYLITTVDEQLKIDLLHGIDMLVLPSFNESFGIVFLEAWACKKPVIGINIGAVAEVIDDGINGFLVKQDNPGIMAQRIMELALDKDLRNRMGINGYNKVSGHFTWDIVTATCRETLIKAKEKFDKANRKK